MIIYLILTFVSSQSIWEGVQLIQDQLLFKLDRNSLLKRECSSIYELYCNLLPIELDQQTEALKSFALESSNIVLKSIEEEPSLHIQYERTINQLLTYIVFYAAEQMYLAYIFDFQIIYTPTVSQNYIINYEDQTFHLYLKQKENLEPNELQINFVNFVQLDHSEEIVTQKFNKQITFPPDLNYISTNTDSRGQIIFTQPTNITYLYIRCKEEVPQTIKFYHNKQLIKSASTLQDKWQKIDGPKQQLIDEIDIPINSDVDSIRIMIINQPKSQKSLQMMIRHEIQQLYDQLHLNELIKEIPQENLKKIVIPKDDLDRESIDILTDFLKILLAQMQQMKIDNNVSELSELQILKIVEGMGDQINPDAYVTMSKYFKQQKYTEKDVELLYETLQIMRNIVLDLQVLD